ncbi:MAG: TIGR00153 family protein [Elusimicrobiota bacterium]
MIFGRKTKKKKENIKSMFLQHMELVDKTLSHYIDSVEAYFKESYEISRQHSFKTHDAEGEADGKRREIIQYLHKSAVLPTLREDLINYLAKQDKIADRIESSNDFLIIQRPQIPENIQDDFIKLLHKIYSTLKPLEEAVKYFFTDYSKISAKIKEVNELEEEADMIENKIIENIFNNSDLELENKMHLNKFFKQTGSIADVVENAGDRFDSLVVKKKI